MKGPAAYGRPGAVDIKSMRQGQHNQLVIRVSSPLGTGKRGTEITSFEANVASPHARVPPVGEPLAVCFALAPFVIYMMPEKSPIQLSPIRYNRWKLQLRI